MGQGPQEVKDPDDIKKEIEETREALAEKVDLLTGQIGQTVETAKSKGFKVAGIVGAAIVGLLTLRRLRNR